MMFHADRLWSTDKDVREKFDLVMRYAVQSENKNYRNWKINQMFFVKN